MQNHLLSASAALLLAACAAPSAEPSPTARFDALVEQLVAGARAEVERQIAKDQKVDRFLVFVMADGSTILGGIDGGGYGPGVDDLLLAMIERSRCRAGADVGFVDAGVARTVDTMLVCCADDTGHAVEKRVPLPRPMPHALRSPR